MAATDKVTQLLANGTIRRIPNTGFAEVGAGIQSSIGNLTITGQSGFAVIFNDAAANIDVRMEGQTQANLFFLDASADFIGFANNNPTSLVDMAGALTVRGIAAPTVSPAGQGRLYFDSGTGKWRISENGAAYQDLIGAGAVSGSGANNQVTVWSGASTLDGTASFTFDSATSAFAVDGSAVFNESGGNFDFRIEGDTEANLLFVDASADNVGFGTGTPSASYRVHAVSTTAIGGAAEGGFYAQNTNAGGIAAILAANNAGTAASWRVYGSATGQTFLGINANNMAALLASGASLTALAFGTDAASVPVIIGNRGSDTQGRERIRLANSELAINDAGVDYDFRVEGDTEPNLLFIDASTDRIGIGTATPATRVNASSATASLDVQVDTALTTGNAGFVARGNGQAGLVYGAMIAYGTANAGTSSGVPRASLVEFGAGLGNTAMLLRQEANAPLVLSTNDIERMRILSTGQVGINTATPAGRLEVRDDTSAVNLILTKEGVTGANDLLEFRTDAFSSLERHTMRWTSNSGAIGLGRYGMEFDATLNTVDFVWRDQFNVSAGSTETMRLKGNGRLGIGTSAPAYNLHVIGSAFISGNLTVQGSTTSISSETMLVNDNHLFINNGYTATSAQTGGLVVNYLPTATTTTVNGAYVAGVAATSNPTVLTAGAATFTLGSFIQFSGGTNPINSGLFEVLSHAANILTIRGIGVTGTVEDFTQNQFVAGASDGATITRVNVSVMRAGTDGVWEVGQGLVTPIVFTDLGTAGSGMAIGNAITSATAGSVLFAGAAGVLAQDNANLFWDDTNNRLGIGTISPVRRLHVTGGGNAERGILNAQHSSDVTASSLNFRKSRGTEASPTTVVSGDMTAFMPFEAHDGTSYVFAAGIVARAQGTITTGSVPEEVTIYIAPGGSGAPFGTTAERITVRDTEVVINEFGNALTDFRVEGDTNANLLFVDASVDRVGFGTATPGHFVDIQAGTLASTVYGLNVTATLPNVAAVQIGANFAVTSSAGSSPTNVSGIVANLSGAYTGNFSYGIASTNSIATQTGTTWGGPTATSGVIGEATGAASGNVIGVFGRTTAGTGTGIGVFARSSTASGTTTIGVLGNVETTGTVTNRIGGYFSIRTFAGLATTALGSAALMADNGTSTADIFVLKDDTTTVFKVVDPGSVPTITGIVEIAPGTVAVSGAYVLHVDATLNSSAFTESGVRFDITGSGTGAGGKVALTSNLKAGYGGSHATVATTSFNASAGAGNDLLLGTTNANPYGNSGFTAFAFGTTTGANIGGYSEGANGNLNIGFIGKATTLKNSATNIGAMGFGRNTGTSPIQIGGFFGLNNSTPTFVSGALIADNSDQTSPIFLARDNGTVVFTIADGSGVNSFGASEVVFNDGGVDIDFRVESDADTNAFVVDAGFDSGRGGVSMGMTPANMVVAGLNIARDTRAGLGLFTYNSTPDNPPANTWSTSQIQLARFRGTQASPSVVSVGDALGIIDFVGYTDGRQTAAHIRAEADTGWGATGTDAPGRIIMATSPDGTAVPVDRLTILANGFVGIGTATPNSTMHVAGSLTLATTTISGNTTLDATHHTVRSDATGGAFTVTLPAAAGVTGRVYLIKKIDSSGNAVTVDGNGSETIDGATTFPLPNQYDVVSVQSNGTGWDIL